MQGHFVLDGMLAAAQNILRMNQQKTEGIKDKLWRKSTGQKSTKNHKTLYNS